MRTHLKNKISKDGHELIDLVNLGERECTRLYGKAALKEINAELAENGLPSVGEVALNTWPESQLCMECVHGVFNSVVPDSMYECWSGVVLGNLATSCSKFVRKAEEE